jgi:hypothetical protein
MSVNERMLITGDKCDGPARVFFLMERQRIFEMQPCILAVAHMQVRRPKKIFDDWGGQSVKGALQEALGKLQPIRGDQSAVLGLR